MKYLIVGLATLIISGCGTTLHTVRPDPKSVLYDTATVINTKNIFVKKKMNLNLLSQIAIVRVDHEDDQYEIFVQESIENLNLFGKVLTKSEFEKELFKKDLAGKVTNISDLLGLHYAYKQYGPFLLIKFKTEFKGNYNFSSRLIVINPENGEELFHVKNEAFNFDGLDKPLFYPMFNELAKWVRENKS